jgi:predicted regulator of Ras-like GTPase activity (Roadblock/LC7/MglB family)
MSKIHDTVADLHRLPGVKGAAVLTLDGLVAAESLDQGLGSEVMAGLTSFLMMTTNRSLEEGNLGRCSQFVLHATNGKAILHGLEDAYLVVMFDQFADVTQVRREIQDAAQCIRRASRLG